MSFEETLRLSERLLGFSLLLQSLEIYLLRDHWKRGGAWGMLGKSFLVVVGAQALLALLLVLLPHRYVLLCLMGSVLLVNGRLQAPFNGGSDSMTGLVLFTLLASEFLPDPWRQLPLAYLAIQTVLSYALAGWAKALRREWWSSVALTQILNSKAYDFSSRVKAWGHSSRHLRLASFALLGFELLFPLVLLGSPWIELGLGMGALFHVGNAYALGLNRFLWAWMAAYPALYHFVTVQVGSL